MAWTTVRFSYAPGRGFLLSSSPTFYFLFLVVFTLETSQSTDNFNWNVITWENFNSLDYAILYTNDPPATSEWTRLVFTSLRSTWKLIGSQVAF